MNRYRAVLFDFDGVLSSTHEDNYAAWVKIFAEYGLEIDEEEYALLEGKRSCEMVPYFLRKNGMDEGLAKDIIEKKNEHYAKHAKPVLYHGVEGLLQMLKSAGLKLAVVSGGSAKRLRSRESLEMLKSFDVILTGEDCTETKPSPQPYLLAARTLGVAPELCLVVENAPLGIQSAKNAGMDCVAICSTLQMAHLGAADYIVEDMTDLAAHLMFENDDHDACDRVLIFRNA